MKYRPYVIVLLLITSVNALSIRHVFKLPLLAIHYWEHLQRGTDVTVIEFLSMHYWGHDINDNDNDRDMELPFKKVDFTHSPTGFCLPVLPTFAFTVFGEPLSFPAIDNDKRVAGHLKALFKPPQLS